MRTDSRHRYRVVLLFETAREHGRRLMRGISHYAREHGPWGLHVIPGDQFQRMPLLQAWAPTGIIARIMAPAAGREVLRSGLPVVAVNLAEMQHRQPKGPWARIPDVRGNGDALGRMAADHLIACGLRHFAYVSDLENTVWSRWREEGFRRRVAEIGGTFASYPVPAARLRADFGAEQAALGRWLQTLPKPVGVMAVMDVRGREAISACIQVGLRVPDEVAVIGIDNDELFCELCDPPLTSVAINAEEAGYQAAKLLHRMMAGERVGAARILFEPTHVVARESTRVVVHDDAVTAAALRFIRLRADTPLPVSEVARQVGLSRRSLEMRFRRGTGRTILEDINAVRHDRVVALLRETALPLEKIAVRCGFANANYLTKVFRRTCGVSPTVFRQKHASRARF